MKSIVLFTLLFLKGFTVDPFADVSASVIAAIKAGNATELSKYFGDKVNVKILDQEEVYSKQQAEAVLKDFFAKHKVKNFTTSHSSSGQSTNQFVVGNLDTTNGKFRVSFLLKKSGESFAISQFRIENDND